METAQEREAKFKVMVDQDVPACQLSGEIDTEAKNAKKLLAAYAEELLRKFPRWKNADSVLVTGPDCMGTCKKSQERAETRFIGRPA